MEVEIDVGSKDVGVASADVFKLLCSTVGTIPLFRDFRDLYEVLIFFKILRSEKRSGRDALG